MKLNSTFIWVFAVVVASVGVFVYLVRQDQAVEMETRMALAHYEDEPAIASAAAAQAAEAIQQKRYVWLGMEPGKAEQLKVLAALKQELEKTRPFDHVIVDQELQLDAESLKLLNPTDVLPLKENLYEVGEKLAVLEKENRTYLVVTAAIYSTATLPRNPLDVMKTRFGLQPLTFSLAYFPVTAEGEKNMTFPCRTADDNTGTAPWGCLVVNKSRFLRKRIPAERTADWAVYMDASGPHDFILVLHKK